ncbi:hypothetical protein R615_14260 [Thalassolituus oleivorans R6-15]|jgi:acetoin utilization protein AcuB|nr:hypothetical protein R615_14260 [Thalassolituus oleivorans R6-15]APR68117.1 CBS domain-containing protein [Thalassolituus oleivorans]
MGLYVFDMGRRIETPVSAPSLQIKATAATQAVAKIHSNLKSPSQHAQQAIHDYQEHTEHEPQLVSYATDIMATELKTLSTTATVGDAWLAIKESGYRHLPVIDEHHAIHAIVFDRDIMATLIETPKAIGNNILQHAMHPVYCILENTDIRQTAQILYQHDLGALPVINRQHQLTGIITRTDLLRLLSHYGPMELWA